ncbi:NAD(P)H-quinone oxidoreductase [Brevundimonas sp. BAL450]|uniref:Quinone oxidoreductase n=1 Tax=Brevundimonas abyssalis TAR-001 TaxID=1391729 RepID=A0A8E0KKN8_9CAUL|nr:MULTISPECIES: NAD(P)H-quinone oxidoreductase [Brevundimonas]MBG7616296.1 NAD(P)H-quinone oxidoreductase [Brevundimonas sp. BAL450]GAD58849.1 quinone oxidoreductase [Brevundimonas abyssalis TAR-001]
MRVIEIRGGAGEAEALVVGERPTPEPGPGQVRIRVRAAGVNRPDILQRKGLYPPPEGASDILGLEVAGEIEAVGADVTRWRPGDRVCALLGGGGYADHAVVDARHVLPVPAGLDFIQAAALPETAFTVFTNVFEDGRLTAGETLLVHGATSGIGVMAIQAARAAGARVIATSRGADKARASRDLGADVSIDASDGRFLEAVQEAGGADVVLDMVGAAYAEQNLKALKPGGRWVVIAFQSGNLAQVDLSRLMRSRLTLTGSTLRARAADEKARLAEAVEATLWPWVADGRIKPIVDRVFPLEEAAAAHRRLESGSHTGKVVLTT